MHKEDNNRIKKILDSLDGIQGAAAPDFFYTRLKARMQNELLGQPSAFIKLRPVLAAASLIAFLIINISTLRQLTHMQPEKNRKATIETFAAAYNLNTETVYE